MVLPALRPIDAFPVDQDGQRLICLRDPEGVVEQQVVLTQPGFFIAMHLDGENDVTDIQYAFAQQFQGQILSAEDLQTLVRDLDGQGFLLTETFATLRGQVEGTFERSEIRPAYLAGKSYPEQRGALRAFLARRSARSLARRLTSLGFS